MPSTFVPSGARVISGGGGGGQAAPSGGLLPGQTLAPYAGGAGPRAGNTQHVPTRPQSYLFAQPFNPNTMVSYLFGGLPGYGASLPGATPARQPAIGRPAPNPLNPQQMQSLVSAIQQRQFALGNGGKGY